MLNEIQNHWDKKLNNFDVEHGFGKWSWGKRVVDWYNVTIRSVKKTFIQKSKILGYHLKTAYPTYAG